MSKEFTLTDLLQELAELREFDFRGYKRATMERRFRKRMFELDQGSYAEYAAYIRNTPEEINELLNTILINVTEFFRDPPAWEILRQDILPPIVEQLKSGSTFRVWSAGCASGEEAYSIAIILMELFGEEISDFDVKIYATDIDEQELAVARRAEYSAEALRRVRPEWREKYFQGTGPVRVRRDIRRMVIFGRSNLAQDAPISHVNLLICRNLLIYFDSSLQKQILQRLHYALEPSGILFLGKSESQLTNSRQFRRLNGRWRIFQRLSIAHVNEGATEPIPASETVTSLLAARTQEELDQLRYQQRYLLESIQLGVIVLSANDVVTSSNVFVLSLFGLPAVNLTGKRIQETDLFVRAPELGAHLQATHADNETARFQVRIKVAGEERLVGVAIRPVLDDRGERSATLIYCEDATVQEKLHNTIEELESTSEELHSANEELETTNEELQSTNEELETTNEELQSTNEELETTNEELQSLNEELETTNQELEERTKELDQINVLYSQTLEKIRIPVMLVNPERRIEFWNSMALKLFGFKSRPPMEFQVEQLPLPKRLRELILRRHRVVLTRKEPIVARHQFIQGEHRWPVNIHFSMVNQEERGERVLIMFEFVNPQTDKTSLPSTKTNLPSSKVNGRKRK
jgi:two-component system, chemotaxis family, CheB/CheR fusion protein